MGRKLGGCLILEAIKGGAGANVWKARHDRHGEVCIKTVRLDPDRGEEDAALRRFRREAEAARRLDHPNIVRGFGLEEADGYLILIQELVGSGDLATHIEDKGGRLSVPEALRIGGDVALGLSVAHAEGLVHRDLKPRNVLLDQNQAKIADLGLVLQVFGEPLDGKTVITKKGWILGTPMYIAPEQWMGAHEVDARVDLYALGVMLYEMVSGRTPFLALTNTDLMRAHLQDAPMPLRPHARWVPESLEELIGRMLRKNPDERPADALEVVNELARIGQQSGVVEIGADTDRLGSDSEEAVVEFLEDAAPAASGGAAERFNTETMPGFEPREPLVDSAEAGAVDLDRTEVAPPRAAELEATRRLEDVEAAVASSGEEDPLVGQVIGGKLRLLSVLGRGGMATVYRAQHTLLDEEFALKVIHARYAADREFRSRFLREAKALLAFVHPGAVSMREFGEHEGLLYMTLDLYHGDNLGGIVECTGALAQSIVFDIACQVLPTLQAAHDAGLVHRDLKPQNLMVEARRGGGWNVRVLDFGIAKILHDAAEAAGGEIAMESTGTGEAMGTPYYMSPEQVAGDSVDGRSDVYSFACILYEILAGQRPLTAPSKQELVYKIVMEQPQALSVLAGGRCTEAFAAAVESALSKRRDDRPQSALEFLHELDEANALGGAPDDSGTGWSVWSDRLAEAPTSNVPQSVGRAAFEQVVKSKAGGKSSARGRRIDIGPSTQTMGPGGRTGGIGSGSGHGMQPVSRRRTNAALLAYVALALLGAVVPAAYFLGGSSSGRVAGEGTLGFESLDPPAGRIAWLAEPVLRLSGRLSDPSAGPVYVGERGRLPEACAVDSSGRFSAEVMISPGTTDVEVRAGRPPDDIQVSIPIAIDAEPPQVTLEVPSVWSGGPLAVACVVTDENPRQARFTLVVDGEPFGEPTALALGADGRSSTLLTVPDGAVELAVRVEAVDRVGRTATDEASVAVDPSGPLISPDVIVDAPRDSSRTRESSLALRARLRGEVRGAATVVLRRGEEELNRWTVPLGEAGQVEVDPLPLARPGGEGAQVAEGPYRVSIEARYADGQTRGRTVTVTVDRTLPEAELLAPREGEPCSGKAVMVRVRPDPSDPIASITVGGEPLRRTGDYWEGSWTLPEADGPAEAVLRVTDQAGNETERPVRVVVDRTPPGVEVLVPGERGATSGEELIVRVRASDQSGVAGATLDGRPLRANEEGVLEGAWSLGAPGAYEATLVVTDQAGNEERRTLSVSVDRTDPTIELLDPPPGTVTRAREVVVRVRGEDDVGVASVTIDGSPLARRPDGSWERPWPLPGEGEQSAQVVVTDHAGNRASATCTVVVDREPPRVEVISPERNSATFDSEVAVRVTSDEPLSEVTLSGIKLVEREGVWEGRWRLQDEERPQRATVIALDVAGNRTETKLFVRRRKVPDGTWWTPTPEQRDFAARSGLPLWFENSIGMKFVLIPPGSFTMGSPRTEAGREEDEVAHKVQIKRFFYMAANEVTNAQFRLMRAGHDSGSYRTVSIDEDAQPATSVSWDDAKAFANWLTFKEGQDAVYELPTEAEWEFACRAGTQTTRFWGDGEEGAELHANVADRTAKGFMPDGRETMDVSDGYFVPAPIGTFKPNPWGLHDMLGNVSEWCNDWYGRYPEGEVIVEPRGPEQGTSRVMRGGSWFDEPYRIRAAYRRSHHWSYKSRQLGIRVIARSVPRRMLPGAGDSGGGGR